MSRVEDHYTHIFIALGRKSIERKILTGRFYSITSIAFDRLECLLDNLIKLTSKQLGDEENTHKPKWWPRNIHFSASVEAMRKEALGSSLNWTSTMQYILNCCNSYYQRQPLACSQYTKIRKYPLRMKRKMVDELLLSSPRKKYRRESFILSPKKSLASPKFSVLKSINNNNNNHVNCSDNNTKLVLAQPMKLMLPVVKLNDVLLRPVPKNDFMKFLQLEPTNKPPIMDPPPICNGDVKFTLKYSCNVPFSSDMGRILLRADRYTLSQQLYERKEEKLEYHLKDEPVISEKTYDVTYNKKRSYERYYNFPRRQYRSQTNSVARLNKALCKPLSIQLIRYDISDYLPRNSLHKQVRVNLVKLDMDNLVKLKNASYLVPKCYYNKK